MKIIAVKLGINSSLSIYTARHSHATVLKRKDVSNEFISVALGHSNLQTTEKYLDSFTDEAIKEYSKLLTDL
jgi:integrase